MKPLAKPSLGGLRLGQTRPPSSVYQKQMWGGRQDLKMKLNLGRERQNHSRVVSVWESSRSCSLDTAVLIFSTFDMTIGSQKVAGPIGETTSCDGDFGGRGLLDASPPCGMKRSDFDLLRIKPLEGLSSSTISSAQFFPFCTPMYIQLHKIALSAFTPQNIRTEEKSAVLHFSLNCIYSLFNSLMCSPLCTVAHIPKSCRPNIGEILASELRHVPSGEQHVSSYLPSVYFVLPLMVPSISNSIWLRSSNLTLADGPIMRSKPCG